MSTPDSDQRDTLLGSLERLDTDDVAQEPAAEFAASMAPSMPPGAAPPTGIAAMAEAAGTADHPLPLRSQRPAPGPVPGLARSLAELREGRTDPVTLSEHMIRRIERFDPDLGAFAAFDARRVRDQAARAATLIRDRDPAAWLAGVPVAHKDLMLTAGLPTAAGSNLLRGYRADADAEVVRQLADAGMVCAGKLNTHEFATGVTGTVSAFGPTLNPWDPQRVPGGSSCGSAAAVAAGLVPVATATDTGGSIRIPAACCGVVGFKPTYGAVSRAGIIPFAWSLDHVGPIARSVDDAAIAFAALQGRRAFTATGAPNREHEPDGLRGLRFGVAGELLARAEPEIAAAVMDAGAALERLGARRCEVSLPPDLAKAPRVAAAIFLTEGYCFHRRTLESHARAYQPPTHELLSMGARVEGWRYLQAMRVRRRLALDFAMLFENIDLLLCATLPMTAPVATALTVDLPEGAIDVRAELTMFTRPFNLTGQPALTLPCGYDSAGLPIGLQMVGAAGCDARLLSVGSAYQRATDWPRWPKRFGEPEA